MPLLEAQSSWLFCLSWCTIPPSSYTRALSIPAILSTLKSRAIGMGLLPLSTFTYFGYPFPLRSCAIGMRLFHVTDLSIPAILSALKSRAIGMGLLRLRPWFCWLPLHSNLKMMHDVMRRLACSVLTCWSLRALFVRGKVCFISSIKSFVPAANLLATKIQTKKAPWRPLHIKFSN